MARLSNCCPKCNSLNFDIVETATGTKRRIILKLSCYDCGHDWEEYEEF